MSGVPGKRLFGTDGIRGTAGEFPLDEATIARTAAALAAILREKKAAPKAIIGRDTRESGGWIEQTLVRGLSRGGAAPEAAGVITTPGIAFLTKAGGYDAGVMISASHNPFNDNGVKVFSADGFKLADELEARIESMVLASSAPGPAGGTTPVPAAAAPAAAPPSFSGTLHSLYRDHLIASAGALRLDGMKVVVDCANGASYRIAPAVFTALGAKVLALSDTPDGTNINSGCGSLYPEAMCRAVVEGGADMGCAFDGDADRTILCDEKGQVCDGDFVLWRASLWMLEHGRLAGNLVVATVMSNLWLEKALDRAGIRMLRAPVGDKYVLEEMLRTGARLGGEASGHVIFRDHATTGDGILTALTMATMVRAARVPLSTWRDEVRPCPQILLNVRVTSRPDMETHPVIGPAAASVRGRLGGSGRLLLRYSGTERLARVMVEAEDEAQVSSLARELAGVIKDAIGES